MNGVAKNDYSWPHLIRMLIKMFSYHANLFENEGMRSEEHTSELQSHLNLVCRLLLEKKIFPGELKAALLPISQNRSAFTAIACTLRPMSSSLYHTCASTTTRRTRVAATVTTMNRGVT